MQVDSVHLSGCRSGWRVSAASVCSQTRALILPIMRLTSTFILGQSLLQGAYSNILAGPGISKTKGNLPVQLDLTHRFPHTLNKLVLRTLLTLSWTQARDDFFCKILSTIATSTAGERTKVLSASVSVL